MSKSKSHQQIVEITAMLIAANMFVDFLNPENRGPNFSWENFPELAGRFAKTQLPLSYPVPLSKKDYAIAFNSAKYWSERAVREAKL